MASCATTQDMEDEGQSKVQLLEQINELQEAVTEMKSAFTAALQQLGSVQAEDQGLRDRVEANRAQCQDQVSEVIKLILSLKTEVATMKTSVQSAHNNQQQLQTALQATAQERDFLLEELVKSGALSDHVRQRLLHSRPSSVRPSSGCHSNDSGVALLLEKAHTAFNQASEQDSSSLPENPPTVSSLVHDYVAALGHPPTTTNTAANNNYGETEGSAPLYDSDSSLTLAAAKSLSLSTSLSKQCGLELDNEPLDHMDHLASTESNDSDGEERERESNSISRQPIEKNSTSVSKWTGAIDANGSELHGLSYKETRRLTVAKELLETERKYCGTLWTIHDVFAQPLKQKGILTTKDINTLFPEEVYQLYEQHCQLLHQLEDRIAAWQHHPTVGDLLSRFTDPAGSDVLRLYTSYVNDFPEVLKTFHKLCRTSIDFTNFLKNCVDHPKCGGLDLGAFLLTPVQRMPRYILLLKQMLKYTERDHKDFAPIHRCLERLRDYLGRLNDSMEHSFQLVAAQIGNQPDPDCGRRTKVSKRPTTAPATSAFLKSHFRASLTVSESSDSTIPGEAAMSKAYKPPRSTSVPRAPAMTTAARPKLKSRSKSDWAVTEGGESSPSATSVGKGHRCCCEEGRKLRCCRQRRKAHSVDRALDDSGEEEDESSAEDAARCLPSSKSLHDIQRAASQDLATTPPGFSPPASHDGGEACKGLRPLSSAHSSHNVGKEPFFAATAAIVHKSGWEEAQADWSKTKKKDQKKKMSIRASIKNMLTFNKKRGFRRSLQLNQPSSVCLPTVPDQSKANNLDRLSFVSECELGGTPFTLGVKKSQDVCECRDKDGSDD